MRPADHLPLPQEAAAGWAERGLCSRSVLGPMLDAPTYQLRDLGEVSSPLCLSLLTSEMRIQRVTSQGTRWARMRGLPRRRVGAVRERGPHTRSRPGEASSPWPPPLTPAPAALPRPAPQAPPYMTPRTPRRSLSQLVSGPGSRAPPAASSSAGHRVRHLPSSPEIAPRRQSQPCAKPAKTWLPAGAASSEVAVLPSASGTCARAAGAGPKSLFLKPAGKIQRAKVPCPALGNVLTQDLGQVSFS